MWIVFQQFMGGEEGAVTVDWVVLSAAVIGLGMIVLTPIAFSTTSTADWVADYIADVPVGSN
jgi:threonine/homoserine/homoserine lactone efflux protein